jgi:putative endonuclease
MEDCSLYIIYSPITNRYYIGVTTDVSQRLIRHNQGTSRSTRAGAPKWILVHQESYPSRSLAMKREYFLKRMKSRIFLEKIITENNNT